MRWRSILVSTIAVAAMALLGGCSAHLGADFGRAYISAFAAQADRGQRRAIVMDGRDAVETMRARHAGPSGRGKGSGGSADGLAALKLGD